jgi:hypothetical protein
MEYVSMSPVFLSHVDSVKSKFALHDYKNIPAITIGHDVWIGERAMVKSGITIGHGAVIGMGSMVTKDIPPYAIWGGNPARLIRYRFREGVIKALLAIQWWHFDDEKLRCFSPLFTSPEDFIQALTGHAWDSENHSHEQ